MRCNSDGERKHCLSLCRLSIKQQHKHWRKRQAEATDCVHLQQFKLFLPSAVIRLPEKRIAKHRLNIKVAAMLMSPRVYGLSVCLRAGWS